MPHRNLDSRIFGFIFARGGSKGISRKNLRTLGGKPLVAHAIESAKLSRHIQRIIVSTDNGEIADVARQFGAEVPFIRPAELAVDDAPEWRAWQHAISATGMTEADVFVSIPPTSPMRAPQDIDACIEELLGTDADIVLTVSEARRNPFFNMVTLDPDGYARIAAQPNVPVHFRQSAPQVYDVTTVAYAASPEFVLRARGALEGRVRVVSVPPERALDIDTEMDLLFAEFCFGKR